MPSKETTISLNCATNQAFEIALKAISQVSDIADYASNSTELAIQARTAPSMKTYGDDIFIKISGSDKQSSIYIVSETDNQVVDWGRNAENLEHIVAQIRKEEKRILPREDQLGVEKTLPQENKEAETAKSTSIEEQAQISVEQPTPISDGPTRSLPWKSIIIGICGIIMALVFFGVIDFNSKPDSNDPAYYYGTWATNGNKIEVTFLKNDVAKCKVVLSNEPIEYETQWAVSPDNGVFWGTYYGNGEYNFMTPEGHLYHYQKRGDRYTDSEISLHKK